MEQSLGPAEVGARLKEMRVESGRTLEDVATASGLSTTMVWKVENPKPDRPLQPAAHLVAEALGHQIATGYELRPLPRRRRRAR
jgi:transcriptional regulator with XRE-family HTH domain